MIPTSSWNFTDTSSCEDDYYNNAYDADYECCSNDHECYDNCENENDNDKITLIPTITNQPIKSFKMTTTTKAAMNIVNDTYYPTATYQPESSWSFTDSSSENTL